MGKLIELTAVYDSTNVSVHETKPATVLIDLDSIQSVLRDWEAADSELRLRGQHITLHPSFASYGENEHGEHAVLDQRILVVRESYEFISNVLASERGVIKPDEYRTAKPADPASATLYVPPPSDNPSNCYTPT